MNKLTRITTAVALALGIAATAVYAHEGPGRGSMERGAQQGRHHGMEQHGDGDRHARGGHEGREARGEGDRHAARSLMTPEERSAFREKMRTAQTPEERQQLALSNRAEMQKRATEKGITLPEHREGHGHGYRRGNGPATAPATPESAN